MLALVAFVYLLLAMRVRIRTEVALCGTAGTLLLSAEAAGVAVRFDGEIHRKGNGIFLTIRPRYGRLSKEKKPGEERGMSLRLIRRYLWFARMGRMELLSLDARIGLGDAAQTAVAAGSMQAIAAAAFSRLHSEADSVVCVMPDFERVGFCAQARCIFSCQAGDMMLAAVKAALKKTGKPDRYAGREKEQRREKDAV